MKPLKKFILFWSIFSYSVIARDYFIYSVEHDLPMGVEGEVLHKNYYINIGAKQGVRKGSILNVFRQVTENDPYESKRRYSYEIKVGELEIIHQDEDASIAITKQLSSKENYPILEIKRFMVGDEVKIKVAD